MLKAPCQNCKERYPSCHAECIYYQEYKKEKEKESNYIKEAKRKADTFVYGIRRKK